MKINLRVLVSEFFGAVKSQLGFESTTESTITDAQVRSIMSGVVTLGAAAIVTGGVVLESIEHTKRVKLKTDHEIAKTVLDHRNKIEVLEREHRLRIQEQAFKIKICPKEPPKKPPA